MAMPRMGTRVAYGSGTSGWACALSSPRLLEEKRAGEALAISKIQT